MRTVADVSPWKGITSPSFRRALGYLRRYWGLLWLTAAFAVLYVPFAFLEPFLVRYLIDNILLARRPDLLLRLAGGASIFFALYGLLEFASIYYVLRLAQRLHAAIKSDQLQNLLAKGLNFHRTTAAGRLIFAFFSDSNQIGTLLSLGLANSALNVVFIVLRGGILYWISPRLFLISLVVIPLQAFVMWRVMKRVMRFSIELKIMDEDLTARIESVLRGAIAVKGFGFADPLRHLWERAFAGRLNLDFRTMIWQKGGFLVVGNIQLVGSFLVLFSGVWMVDRGLLTLGGMFAFLTVAGRLTPSVQALIGFAVTIQEALVGLERFYRVYDLPDEAREFAHGQAGERTLAPEDLDHLTLRDVEVDHGTARIRIPCDLRMERGKHYLWHGPNGAGKTSLGLALAGLVPHRRGSILAGDTALCDFALPSVRAHVLYVGHEPYWPERTLGENFSNVDGDGVLEHARLQAALELAEAADILDSLPLGMRTTLTGKELSAGENQRLFLAMALYRAPRVLILDEALASVGSAVVSRIVGRLVQRGPATQVIFVSHSTTYAEHFQGELRFPARVR